MDQLILSLAPARLPSFDNFIIGCNAEAVQAVRELSLGRSTHRLIYLWGEAGSGRTHLLRAAALAMLRC